MAKEKTLAKYLKKQNPNKNIGFLAGMFDAKTLKKFSKMLKKKEK